VEAAGGVRGKKGRGEKKGKEVDVPNWGRVLKQKEKEEDSSQLVLLEFLTRAAMKEAYREEKEGGSRSRGGGGGGLNSARRGAWGRTITLAYQT